MKKNIEKENMSITKIILFTFTSIMLVTALIIGTIIFRNWFTYADKNLTENINRYEKDVFNIVEFYMDNHWSGMEQNNGLNDNLEIISKDKNSIALVIDKDTGNLIGNSIDMDNYLRFQNGTIRPVKINNMGYPALTEAYNSYLNTNVKSYKLTNIEAMLYINISEYKVDEFDWLIFIAIPDTQFTSAVKDGLINTIVFTAIALGIAVILYLALIRKLLKPAVELLNTAKRFANGDLSQRARIVRNDEVGTVARAFNNMADTIHGLVANLEDKVAERTLELKKANEMISDNRNQLKLILDSTAEGIFGLDTEGNFTFCNVSCIEFLGYSHQDELIGKNMYYQIHHDNKDSTPINISEGKIIKAIKDRICIYSDDEVFWRKDGTCFDVEYHVYPQLKDDEIVGAVVSFMDITESKKAKEQIEYLSSHDSVTGLFNRVYFDKALKEIDISKNLPISIIYGDVNGLKLLNDILGHKKGDELLKKTADVLKGSCRDDDIVARVGGDEFVILLLNTKAEEANLIIQRIKNKLAGEEIGGIRGSISLAFDTKTTPEQDIEMVYNNAEAEMYIVKSLERKSVNSKMLNDIMECLYGKCQWENLHSINVSRMGEQIAINMNLSETEVKRVRDAGFYHDIGKTILNEKLLNKDAKLREQEREEIERHPLTGYRILNLFDETMAIAETVLTHHERWDGKGYPKGIKGEEIPLIARIISVAEDYDSMTNKVGGKGVTLEEAIEEIKSQSGIKYDPLVVESFLEVVNKKG